MFHHVSLLPAQEPNGGHVLEAFGRAIQVIRVLSGQQCAGGGMDDFRSDAATHQVLLLTSNASKSSSLKEFWAVLHLFLQVFRPLADHLAGRRGGPGPGTGITCVHEVHHALLREGLESGEFPGRRVEFAPLAQQLVHIWPVGTEAHGRAEGDAAHVLQQLPRVATQAAAFLRHSVENYGAYQASGSKFCRSWKAKYMAAMAYMPPSECPARIKLRTPSL